MSVTVSLVVTQGKSCLSVLRWFVMALEVFSVLFQVCSFHLQSVLGLAMARNASLQPVRNQLFVDCYVAVCFAVSCPATHFRFTKGVYCLTNLLL